MKAIEYYEKSPDYEYVAINGEQTIEKVHDAVRAFVEPLLSKTAK